MLGLVLTNSTGPSGQPQRGPGVRPPSSSSMPNPPRRPSRGTFIANGSRIARTAGGEVLRSGGVVRGITNWGAFRLPRPTTKHQARHTDGHHFIMRFDSSAQVQQNIRRTLALDPRMIRHSVVKLGNKLDEIKDVQGHVVWNNSRNIWDSL